MLTRDDAAWVAKAIERDAVEGALRAAQTLLHAVDQLDRLAAQHAPADDLGKHEADVADGYRRAAQEVQDGRERLGALLDDKAILAELDAANPRPVVVAGLAEQNVCMAVGRLALARENSLRLVGWHRESKRRPLTVLVCLRAVAHHERFDLRMVETELRKEWQRVLDNRKPAPPQRALNDADQTIIEAINEWWSEGLQWPTNEDIARKAHLAPGTVKQYTGPMARYGILEKGPGDRGYKVRT